MDNINDVDIWKPEGNKIPYNYVNRQSPFKSSNETLFPHLAKSHKVKKRKRYS